jgi:hypothetical protein
MSELKLVRYCPECGSVGEVGHGFINCCPDGNRAVCVPEIVAKQAAAGFAPTPPSNADSGVSELVKACELLMQQYDAETEFTMGGALTNEPFLRIRAALAAAALQRAKETIEARASEWDKLAKSPGRSYAASYAGELRMIARSIDAIPTNQAALDAITKPLEERIAELEKRKDGAYLERNQVVSALSKCFPAGRAKTAIEGWSEDWHGCVYIDLPTGQVSWHFHDSQAYLFDHLTEYCGTWDRHDTPEKYRRLAALAQSPQQQQVDKGESVQYLLGGARFKLSFQQAECEHCGEELDEYVVKPLDQYKAELEGEWVALVPAANDQHLKFNSPTAEAAARDMQKRAAEVVRELLGGRAGDSLAADILALPLNQQGKD